MDVRHLLALREAGGYTNAALSKWVEAKVAVSGCQVNCELPPHAFSAVSIALDCSADGYACAVLQRE